MARSLFSRRLVLCLVLAGAALSASGCGPSTAVSPDEGESISLVLDVSDATRSEADFAALFATGRAPAKGLRNKYAAYSFSPVGKPSVNGEEASLVVAVADSDDKTIGEVSWTAVKEQGKWKLASAPLP